jgi:hypothetical protein
MPLLQMRSVMNILLGALAAFKRLQLLFLAQRDLPIQVFFKDGPLFG